MAEQVTMQDGSEQELIAHLSDTHHKGTRGFTDAFLHKMHRSLHLGGSEAEHEHPDIQPETEEGSEPQPAE